MTEQKLSPILEAQTRINQASEGITEAQQMFLNGEISRREMENLEQLYSLSGQTAAGDRLAAENEALGKKTTFKQKLARFFFG